MALKSLQDALANSQHEEALDEFRRLQTSDPSSLVPAEPRSATFLPLYRVLFRAFHQFPEEIRVREAVRTAAAADHLLREILEDGALEEIPDLILQSPGSAASLQGHLILARQHRARGQDIAARAWLTPLLLDAVLNPFAPSARALLRQLQDSSHATAQRDTDTSGTSEDIPEHLHWHFRPVSSPRLRKQIRTFREAARQAGVIAETTWTDVVTPDAIFRRTMRGVSAVNISTGRPDWEYPLLPDLDSVLTSDRANSALFNGANPVTNSGLNFSRFQQSPLADAFCRDNVFGRISTDEKRVYLIATEGRRTSQRIVINRGMMSRTSRFGNARLIALERSSGRRIWSTGAEAFRDHVGRKSGSCWISGPPAASRNRVYCVFEWKGEMRLACIAARTGELIWSSLLAYPDQTIEMDAVRRLWGATPRTEGGLIWCPTTAGWTVCIDEVTRSVIWASRLKSKMPSAQTFSIARGRPVAVTPAAPLASRWPVGRMLRYGDTLIIMPHESHEIAV